MRTLHILGDSISQVEFLFPNTLLDTLSSLQEYNNVDLYFCVLMFANSYRIYLIVHCEFYENSYKQ